jgi:hypothetical protein
MIVLREKATKKAINVSYTEVGALYTTDTSGNFLAFKNAKIVFKPNAEFIQVEGDTRLSNDYVLEPYEPITFLTDEQKIELDTLKTLERECKKKKERLSKKDFYRLLDLSKLSSNQQAEKAIAIKARRLNYYVNSSKKNLTD